MLVVSRHRKPAFHFLQILCFRDVRRLLPDPLLPLGLCVQGPTIPISRIEAVGIWERGLIRLVSVHGPIASGDDIVPANRRCGMMIFAADGLDRSDLPFSDSTSTSADRVTTTEGFSQSLHKRTPSERLLRRHHCGRRFALPPANFSSSTELSVILEHHT